MRGSMSVYVAGPMRGIADFNFPAFHQATALLRSCGFRVFSPAERDLEQGFDGAGLAGTAAELDEHAFDLREALAMDLSWICLEADAVITLDGWEYSKGALAEVRTAIALGLPVYRLGVLELLEEINVDSALARAEAVRGRRT